MKYKVGDKVKVRNDLVVGKTYGYDVIFTDDMARYKGQVTTISRVGNDFYKIKDDIYYWSWVDEMFEDVSDDENNTTIDGRGNAVDVGYYLKFCGHRVIKDVYQDGIHDGKPFFTSADGFNQYLLPKDAIEWVIPHEREIDL